VQLTRKTIVLAALLLALLAASAALYFRYRVNRAVAECDTPAPPQKPATAAPSLPGFSAGDACGPGGSSAGSPSGKKQ
jgi:hypothetical protein